MRVLLISPLDPARPTNSLLLMGGESTYTKSLLTYPPQHVTYVHFTQALEQGLITKSKWCWILNLLIKIRIFPPGAGNICITLNEHFDLIHCHAYSVLVCGPIKPPVILSDSSSNSLYLEKYLHWSRFRVAVAYLIKRQVYTFLGTYDPDVNSKRAAKLVVFSDFAKRLHKKLDPLAQNIAVIPPGLPPARFNKKSTNRVTILFAGVWFSRKGGEIVLAAWKKLMQEKRYNTVKLQIIGSVPHDLKSEFDSHIHLETYVSYDTLLREVYPSADIFISVPPFVEGYGMAVIEAAAYAVPAIVSRIGALPELVQDGKTGIVVKPNDIDGVYQALKKLINHKTYRQKLGIAARERFMRLYSIQATNTRLLRVYFEALARD